MASVDDHAQAPLGDGPPPRHGFTAAEVEAMTAAGVFGDTLKTLELINGDLVHKVNQGPDHWALAQKMSEWLLRRLPTSISLAPNGPLRLGAHDEPEPDFFLFPADVDVNAVRGPQTLLVTEIAVSSLSYDLDEKAALYARYGVRRYWVVDIPGRVTHVHELGEDGRYGDPKRVAFAAPLHAPGVAGAPLILETLAPPPKGGRSA